MRIVVLIIVVIAIFGLLALLLGRNRVQAPQTASTAGQEQQTPQPQTSSPSPDMTYTSSAKGVVQVGSPTPSQEIRSPLTVTGFVYGDNGTLTIRLKQKESGVYVTEDKTVRISGASDQITFAEAIQFGLPAMPQPGILEVIYKDNSGKGLDDRVSLEVNFPTDLGSGL